MATETTALTMMNRLRRLHRYEDVSSFGDELSKVLLDLMNESMRDVLESYKHTFDERSDLTIKTFPTYTGSTLTVTANSTVAQITSYTGEWIGKASPSPERFYDATVYLVCTSDSTFGSTAFRVTDGYMLTSSILQMNLERPWTGTSVSGTGTYKLYAFEYALPSTVRGIVSVRDQKNEIRLAQAMSVYEFESLIPRPQDRSGSSPELAVITGYRPPTYLSSNSANTGVSSSNSDYSMALYPIPGDGRAINLTYVYRHPELVATTDKLKGVPSHIVDTIIMLTHGKARMTIEKDIAGGSAIIDRISRSFAAKAQGENPDPFRRKPMRSLDHKSQTDWPHGRYPRPFYTP
jgi:hypothetical protein